MMRRTLLGAVVLLACPLAAQTPAIASTHAVRGIVFDSISMRTLAGATVQVTSRDSVGPLYATTSDSAGRFRIAGVPAGRYLLGFYHDALTALGLDAPVRPFELAADTLASVDIGVPSAPVVRALRCGTDSGRSPNGLLAGFIRAAGRGDATAGATPGATVAVEWRAIALDPGNYRTITQRSAAAVAGDGTYTACGLPIDAPLLVRVTLAGHRTFTGPVAVPTAGVARQDIRMTDSATTRGSANLRGRVVHENGKPATDGRVAIAALAREVPIRNGAFAFTELPAGTWVVEARTVGVDPQPMVFDVTDGDVTSLTITLPDRTQRLDAVTVVGERGRNTKILEEVLQRQRSSFGTTFLPGNAWLEGANQVSDVLRAAKGFKFNSPTEVYGRALPGRLTSSGTRCNKLAVYLNGESLPIGFTPTRGSFQPLGLETLNNMVRVRDILAIEAYADMTAVPVQWRVNDGRCAVVAVWTSR